MPIKIKIKQSLKQSKIIDIILIALLMALTVYMRLPALNLNSVFIDQRDSYRDENSLPYLFDPDSYYYARKTREVVETGDYSVLKKSSEDNLRVTAEEGLVRNFFPVSMALVYKVVDLFSDLKIEEFFVLSAPFIYSLAIIPAYIFVKKRSKTRFGAVIAGFFIALAPGFFGKTCFINFDTDIILAVLPLGFMCCFLDSLREKGTKSYIYLALSFIFFVMLALSWGAYGPYYYLLIASVLFIFINQLIRSKSLKSTIKNKEFLLSFSLLTLCSLFCIVFLGGIDTSALDTALTIITPDADPVYPSASVFVNELRTISFFGKNLFVVTSSSIVSHLGGIVAFSFVIVSTVVLFIRSIVRDKKSFPEISILIAWMLATLVASIIAERFQELSVLPWALLLGLGVSFLYDAKNSKNIRLFIIRFALVFIIAPFRNISSLCRLTPSATDAFIETASYIAEDAGSEDALIVSWWDYGYVSEYVSRQRAFADGGTYNGELYVYLSRILLANSPEEAETEIRAQLEKYNLPEKRIYLVAFEGIKSLSGAISYYANWETDKSGREFSYDNSLTKSMLDSSQNQGNFKFRKYIKDKADKYSSAIYRLDLED